MVDIITSNRSSNNSDDESRYKDYFVDDDEEIFLSLTSNPNDIIASGEETLRHLVIRFYEDHCIQELECHNKTVWDDWCNNVQQSMGLTISCSKDTDIWERFSNDASMLNLPVPPVLESEYGKYHLDAVSSILSISRTQAIQLTIATMRSLHSSVSFYNLPTVQDNNSSTFQSLIGTRVFLNKLIDYYYRQRLARVSVIAECLRLEQPKNDDIQSNNIFNTITSSLDLLDQLWKINGHNRGLFRLFLLDCCQPETSLSYVAMLPAEKLRGCNAPGYTDDRDSWRLFMRERIDQKRSYEKRTRLEALEALLSLLYERIDNGVHRDDFAMLLMAFKMQNYFKATKDDDNSPLTKSLSKRMPYLAGLAIVESISLWRTMGIPESQHDNWVSNHPLLFVENSNDTELELKNIARFIDDSCMTEQVAENPEALALLSYGLLLRSAGNSCEQNSEWYELSEIGTNMFVKANSTFDTFSYFYSAMEYLVVPTTLPSPWKTSGLRIQHEFHDMILVKELHELQMNYETKDDSSSELSAPSLLYANIGKELLTATIHSYKTKMFPEQYIPDQGNLKLFSSLVFVIFRQSPILCKPVWEEISSRNKGTLPLALLVNGANRLANHGVSSKMSDEESMMCIMPMIQIFAALAIDPKTTVWILSNLPEGVFHFALNVLVSRSSNQNHSLDFIQCRKVVLQSLASITVAGDSSLCRDSIRRSLRGTDDQSKTSGVQNLLQIAMVVPLEDENASHIFDILSVILVDAPINWILDLLLHWKHIQNSPTVWESLFTRENKTLISLMNLINGIIKEGCAVISAMSVTDSEAVVVLEVVQLCVQSASSLLLSTSTNAFLAGGKTLSYCAAEISMACITSTLVSMRPVIELHHSENVRQVALDILYNVIYSLGARGHGEAVFMFAVAPVYLSMAIHVESTVKDAELLRLTRGNNENVAIQYEKMELYGNYLKLPSQIKKMVPEICVQFVDSLTVNDFDLDAICSCGWLHSDDDPDSCLRAAYNALRLINTWSRTIPVMVHFADQANQSLEDIGMLSPHVFLNATARRPNMDWKSSQIFSAMVGSNCSLLTTYLVKVNRVSIGSLALETINFFSSCFEHKRLEGRLTIYEIREPILRNQHESTVFREAIQRCIFDLHIPHNNCMLLPLEKGNIAVGLSCLHALDSFFNMSVLSASKTFNLQDGVLVSFLFNQVEQLSTALQSRMEEILAVHRESLCLFYTLKAGFSALSILRMIWKQEKKRSDSSSYQSSSYGSHFSKNSSEVLQAVAKLAFGNSTVFAVTKDPNPELDVYKTLLMDVMATALDFLSIEIEWQRSSSVSSAVDFLQYIETALQTPISNFADTVQDCASMASFQSLFKIIESHQSTSHQSVRRCLSEMDLILESADLTDTRLNNNPTIEIDFAHVLAVAKWYEIEDISSSYANRIIFNLNAWFKVFHTEMRCLIQWKTFSQSLSVFMKECNFFTSDDKFCVKMAEEILKVMYKNMLVVQNAIVVPRASQIKLLVTCKILAGLVLSLLHKNTVYMSESEWTRCLDFICKTTELVLQMFLEHPLVCTLIVQQMMILGNMLLKISPGGSTILILKNDMLLTLTTIACKIIGIGTKQIVSSEHFAGCYNACVSLWTSLLDAYNDETLSDESEIGFMRRLSDEMQKHNIVRLLLQHAGASREVALPPSAEVKTSEIDNTIYEASRFFVTIDFFIKLASIGNIYSLRLLQSNGATRILFTSSDDVISRVKSSVEADSVNEHEVNVLRAKLKFITICIRAVNETSGNRNDDLTSHFVIVATEFIGVHNLYFLGLLDSCGKIFDKDGSLLTPDLMKDAESFMSLIVELSVSKCRDAFQRECSEILLSIRVCSMSMISSLCMFLGASAAAREIFRAIDHNESESLVNVDIVPSSAFSTSEQRIFAGGIQNAKHEAIRYCHFVSAVSPRKIQQFLESEQRTQTMASLENACRKVVTEEIGLIEVQVAKCFYTTLLFLWKTHPAANCFVCFSGEDALQFDAMRFVQSGAVIGFRFPEPKTSFVADGVPNIQFGRVVGCNTVRREWLVQIEDPVPKCITVSCCNLAGIENLAKRTPILAYMPAPDSSASFDTFHRSTSLGHLILGLRWCCQFFAESEANSSLQGESQAACVRLAELLVALLGTEISIREEIGRIQRDALSKIDICFASQLFDLLEEGTDLSEYTASVGVRREGRLKPVLHAACWKRIRGQLGQHLSIAVEETTTKLDTMTEMRSPPKLQQF